MPYKDITKRKEYNTKYQRLWRNKNRSKIREIWKTYYWRHRESKLKKTAKGNLRRYHRMRLEVLFKYGGNPPKCSCCGESIIEFLTIDHINGNGRKEHRFYNNKYGGGIYGYLLKTRKKPKSYRVLCYNCNCARSKYGGICPHKRQPGR